MKNAEKAMMKICEVNDLSNLCIGQVRFTSTEAVTVELNWLQ